MCAATKASSWCSFYAHPDRIAFADKGCSDLFERFRRENHLLNWRPYRPGKEPPPYHDHGRTYQMRYEGRTRQVHVFHIFVGLKKERFDEIVRATSEWAIRNQKIALVYDASYSWYYNDPNGIGTALIILHDPDVNVIIP